MTGRRTFAATFAGLMAVFFVRIAVVGVQALAQAVDLPDCAASPDAAVLLSGVLCVVGVGGILGALLWVRWTWWGGSSWPGATAMVTAVLVCYPVWFMTGGAVSC